MDFSKVSLLLSFFIISVTGFSQKSNEIRIYYGISDAALLRNDDLDGGGSYEVDSYNEMGIRYLKDISPNWSLETGINYGKAEVVIEYRVPGFAGGWAKIVEQHKLEIISIPVLAKYNFWNYFFINGGALVDFQISENTFNPHQSGIGYTLGFGGEFNYKNLIFFLNPNFKRHAVIPFEQDDFPFKLTEFGVQAGIGYRF
ncbi:MAG TPA: hypothetical protein VFM60_05510 [Salinimicrobium sp.]|nr:hypothetical protein [Salinimicrobium sp.]